MKITLTILVIILMSLISFGISCSCNGGESPSDVVQEFYKAVNSGDTAQAMKYVNIGNVLAPSEMSLTSLKNGIEKMKIVEEDIEKVFNSEMASVIVEIHYTPKGSQEHFGRVGDIYNITLEKHDSEWKIEFINRTSSITGLEDTATNDILIESVDDENSDRYDDSTPSQEFQGGVYNISNYPKNPETPGEVVAAYFFLLDAYARNEVSIDFLIRFVPEKYKEEIYEQPSIQSFGIKEIKILNVEIDAEGKKATVEYWGTLESGLDGKGSAKLIKENGLWKIEDME